MQRSTSTMGSASALVPPQAAKSAKDSHESAAAPSAERAMWATVSPSSWMEAKVRDWNRCRDTAAGSAPAATISAAAAKAAASAF